jgi:hypothetical protein
VEVFCLQPRFVIVTTALAVLNYVLITLRIAGTGGPRVVVIRARLEPAAGRDHGNPA